MGGACEGSEERCPAGRSGFQEPAWRCKRVGGGGRAVISSWLVLMSREGVNQLSREQGGHPKGSKENISRMEARILRGAWGRASRERRGTHRSVGSRSPEKEEPPTSGPPTAVPKEATGPPRREASGPRGRWPQGGQEAAFRVQGVQERAYVGGHSSQAFLKQNGVWGAGPRLRSKGEGFERKYEGTWAAGGARGSGGRRAYCVTYTARGFIPSP